jgi:hypothetical protein
MVGSEHEGAVYRIQVQGHLDSRWSEWFDGLLLTCQPDGSTLLTGPVADQAALYGLLERLRDLGLRLLSVNCMRASEPGDSHLDGYRL